MASEEGPKPSPTETTETTSHGSSVSDDEGDQEVIVLHDDVIPNRNSNQHQQTRFSFYDAQEVQTQFASNVTQSSMDSTENKNLYRYNFYDPATLPKNESPVKMSLISTGATSGSNVSLSASIGSTGMPSSSSTSHLQSQPLYIRENLAAVENNLHRAPERRHQKQLHMQPPPPPIPQQPLQDHHRTTSQGSLHCNNLHSHTDDILRSLQETEEQRMQILQPTTNLMDPPHVLANKAAASEVSLKAMNTETDAVYGADSSTTGASTSNHSVSNNPYEDAIREALDLLRKHRSPPPSPGVSLLARDPSAFGMDAMSNIPAQPVLNATSMMNETNNAQASQHSDLVQSEDVLSRTPASVSSPERPPDIISSDSLTDALQEAKLKAKQRQERMAEYASRLQEFKSSLPAEQLLQMSNSQDQEQVLAIPAAPSSNGTPDEIATRDQSLTSYALSSPDRSQQQPISTRNDLDSVGLMSDISQSTRQFPPTYSSQFHQQQPLPYQQQQQRAVDEEVQKGVEKVLMAILEASKSTSSQASAYAENTTSALDTASTQSAGTVSEVLLRAMDEVLYGRNGAMSDDRSSIMMGSVQKESSTSQSTYNSHSIMKRSSVGGERSVVDELLAEADEDLTSHYWPREEKKMTENDAGGQSNTPHTVLRDKHSEKNIDTPIKESQRGSTCDQDDAAIGTSAQDSEVDEDDELQSDYDEGESYEEDECEREEGRRPEQGVLGPLSRGAGGTTGVVLDTESPSSPSKAKSSDGYFSNAVKYVKSALTPDRQRVLDNRKESVAQNKSDEDDEEEPTDVEALELMRTLCAHLLPFGVDQVSNLEDVIPSWDEDNPNEAGYRIIRLSKPQLRRVESAFDAMINSLKNKSQSQLKGSESEYDANFIRELQEAERLLQDEENRNHSDGVGRSVLAVKRTAPPQFNSDCEEKTRHQSKTTAHPDFPGIKTAGKGEMGDLEYFHLPIIFKSHVTGFEPTKDMVLEPGNVVAGQYLVESELGSAAFSTAYRCVDLSSDAADGHEEVCLKVIKNTKDFFDQSLDEIKILELLRQTGQCDENFIIRMKTFFYYREHLVIVTELLRQNLFEFGKFIIDNEEEPYFTIPRLAFITRQCMVALRFVHSLGLVHSDVKPENILLGSYSRAKIKLIDFGSSCYLTDRQSSYIQSRSYRAPEVVLGLPYSGKIDVWSLGCVVAEMFTGEVTFQNDSIVSMLSRIEAICGSFPRHMVAQGRQSGRFFTKSGLLYEVVDDSDNESSNNSPPGPNDKEPEDDTACTVHYDIFQPKNTTLSSRIGFDADLMDDYEKNSYSGSGPLSDHELQQIFTDFVARLLTIDPDSRPTADEALQHPWMLYAATLTEEQIKYP